MYHLVVGVPCRGSVAGGRPATAPSKGLPQQSEGQRQASEDRLQATALSAAGIFSQLRRANAAAAVLTFGARFRTCSMLSLLYLTIPKPHRQQVFDQLPNKVSTDYRNSFVIKQLLSA